MIWFALLVLNVALVYLLVLDVRNSMLWPPSTPRPHHCDHCWRAYQTSSLLSLHQRGEHPERFEVSW